MDTTPLSPANTPISLTKASNITGKEATPSVAESQNASKKDEEPSDLTTSITKETTAVTDTVALTNGQSQSKKDQISTPPSETPPPPTASMAPINKPKTPTGRQRKVSGSDGFDVKSKIIDFMRDRPFLWNSKHPSYKDNRTREQEFNIFSQSINMPTIDIKRIWHVLRTNFFRAHKIMLDRPQNLSSGSGNGSVYSESGDKLWKYYLAMEFILEGTTYCNNNGSNCVNDTCMSSGSSTTGNNTADSPEQEDNSLTPTTRLTRSSKMLKDAKGIRRDVPVQSTPSVSSNDISMDASRFSDFPLATSPIYSSPQSPSLKLSTPRTNINRNLKLQRMKANNIEVGNLTATQTTHTSLNQSFNITRQLAASSSGFNTMSLIPSYESDEDYLYARSLSSTLKKFDPTTKEVIKLKFQEIIVEFMQKMVKMKTEEAKASRQPSQ